MADAQQEAPGLRGRQATRRRLVEAATEVFADRGYHAATLNEIATRAGLTTGAVYSTFGSKKALLVAACVEAAGDDGIDVEFARARGLREALEAVVLDAARTGLEPASLRIAKLQLEAIKLGLDDPQLLAGVSDLGRVQLARVTRLIEAVAGREHGALPMPAQDLALLVAALLNGLGLLQLVDPELVPERLYLRGVHALLGVRTDDAQAGSVGQPARARVGGTTSDQRRSRERRTTRRPRRSDSIG